MTVKVLQTGLDPDLIDFSRPGFEQFAGIDRDRLHRQVALRVWRLIHRASQ